MRQSSYPNETKTNFLNDLQSQALGLYSEGNSCSAIGDRLGLSEHCISIILQTAVQTLGAENLAHAVGLAQKSARD